MTRTAPLPPGALLDGHVHLWDPGRRRHDWLAQAPQVLRRRYDLEDYAAVSAPHGVQAALVVQALADEGESEDLLGLAERADLIAGVVGWVELASPGVDEAIGALRRRPGGAALVGIRHLVQSEPDPGFLARPEVVRGLRAVAAAGLVYDLLVRPPQLPAALAAVDAVEDGRFVLDHGGKPAIADAQLEPWASLIGELSARPHVVCKLSGLASEAGQGWTPGRIAPYVERLLETFGPQRLCFGSDWPVCLPEAGYDQVVGLARSLLEPHTSAAERRQIFAGTAVRTYRLALEV